MKHKKTVTIGIPAHNEEKNINNLLNAVLAQKRENFELEKIIVICDGCSDATEKKAKEFAKKHQIAEVVSDGERKGKAQRLNELYRINASEIIVTLDADVVLADADVLGEMVKNINAEYAFAGANFQPLQGKTLFEKFINAGEALWYEVRKNDRNGDSIYNIAGCAVALDRDFAKSIFYPEDTVSDQVYLYFSAKSSGRKFFFSQKAVVLYRNPGTLEDFLSMESRSQFGRQAAGRHFRKFLASEYKLHNVDKKRIVLKRFIANPVYTFFGALFLLLIRLAPTAEDKNYKNGFWKALKSTKNI